MATLLIDQIDDNSFIQLDKEAIHSGESTAEFARFLLAAGMYHAQKMSFQKAATLSGLGFNGFKKNLRNYFSTGYVIANEVVEDDISMAKKISNQK
jgi:ribosomal protein L4